MKTRRIFKPSDSKSGDGMLTTVWGPSLWHFLHTMSFNYPVEPTPQQKKDYRDYILSLEQVLPCKYCRMNLEKNFKNISQYNLCGVKFLLSGRIRGKSRASSNLIQIGSTPTQTLSKTIDFATDHVYTLYGVFGIKMWTYLKKS